MLGPAALPASPRVLSARPPPVSRALPAPWLQKHTTPATPQLHSQLCSRSHSLVFAAQADLSYPHAFPSLGLNSESICAVPALRS